MRQPEQRLSFIVDLILCLPDIVLLLKPFESLDGLFRLNTLNHGPIAFIVISKVLNIFNELFDASF